MLLAAYTIAFARAILHKSGQAEAGTLVGGQAPATVKRDGTIPAAGIIGGYAPAAIPTGRLSSPHLLREVIDDLLAETEFLQRLFLHKIAFVLRERCAACRNHQTGSTGSHTNTEQPHCLLCPHA